MAETDGTKSLTIRISESELARLESLRERLQTREGSRIRVTQRMTIMEALDRLEAHLARLERDKGRQR